jgi:hemin uptake protein HemP
MNQPASKDNRDLPADSASKSAAEARSIAMVDNRIDSREVFVTSREVIIAHGSDQYRLRLTSQNKLILTK